MTDTGALFSSFKYFETFFNNTTQNTLLLMNDKGVVLAVNNAFAKRFGYGQAEIAGQSAAILFTEEDQKKGMLQKELNSVLNTGHAADDNFLVSKDKTLTWVSGESVLVKNDEGEVNILKVVQNIHQQKVAEISLQRLNEFNDNILGSIEDVVIVLDEHFNIVNANQAFGVLYKYDEGNIRIINFKDLIKPYDVAGVLQIHIERAIRSKKEFINIPIEIEVLSGESACMM